MSDRLTAGAARVLARSIERIDAGVLPFRALIETLITDDGSAAELLRNHNVAISDWPNGEANGPVSTDNTPTDPGQWRFALTSKADHFSLSAPDTPETGSEHLLLAALELDGAVRFVLDQFGIDSQSVQAALIPAEKELDIPDGALVQIVSAESGTLSGGALFRTLDASANRSREGLRIVEDFVRFQLNDAYLSYELKQVRHRLTTTLNHLGQEQWVPFRDTTNDVGTTTTTTSERHRESVIDVVRANMKRVEESLRSLEENSKVIDPDLSREIEQCRYRFYTLEKAIATNFSARERLAECRLYLLVTDALCRYGAETTIKESITSGVDVVQIREKGLTDRELIDYANRVREWTDTSNALFIMNDRPDVAAIVGADGVHLGQDDLAVHEARQIIGGNKLIGVSTHCLDDARRAILDGADYLGVGPVFPSQTKSFDNFAGLKYVTEVSEETSLPAFSIGGINEENLHEVISSGSLRVAVSSAICNVAHPKGIALTMANQLQRAVPSD